MTPRRPRVALATRTPLTEAGGIESSVRELAPRIAARRPGWDVRAVHAFSRVTRSNRVPFLGDLAAAALLALKSRRYDVVLVNGAEYAFPRVVRRAERERTIVVWHGTRAAEIPALVPAMSVAVKVYFALEKRLQRWALRAKGQIAVSDSSAREIAREYGARRVVVIPNGAGGAARPSTRRVPGTARRVVWIGTSTYKKGLDIALAACERARHRHPALELVVIGVAPDAARPLPGWVEVTGRIDHAAVLGRLDSADVLLATSRYEGCSVAAIEALALGVPLVAGPSVAWMVHGGGVRVNGFAWEPYADALEALFDAPERLAAMSQAALLDAARFDWEIAADRYVAEIEACLCGA